MPGKKPETIAELRLALAIAEESVSRNPTNPNSQDDLMNTHIKLGRALLEPHDREATRAQYRIALDIANQLAAKNAGAGWKKSADEIANQLAKLDHK